MANNANNGGSQTNTSGSCSKKAEAHANRKARTFFTLQRDIHLMQLCTEHNPYQLGKQQWEFIVAGMQEKFNTDFLLRTLKDRANKLVEKYQQEQLEYKRGTEEEVAELGVLLEEVVGYIDASAATINHQQQGDAFSDDEEIDDTWDATTPTPRQRTPQATARLEKRTADRERDELLAQAEMAPEPRATRRRRNTLLPEDELIKQKQEQDHAVELQRVKLEERKVEIEYALQREKLSLEREKLEYEREKLRVTEDENKRRDLQQQHMHELLLMLAKK